MKNVIFYFTGTGNSLKVARDLARELGDTGIINLAHAFDKELDLSCDRIGLVYPVYEFGMPLIVRRFVNKFKGLSGKYFFAVATYGGLAADTLGQNQRIFHSLGISLSAGFLVKMPGNYTPLYGALPVEKQNKLFKKEEERVKQISGIIRQMKQVKIERANPLINLFFSTLYNLASRSIPFQDKSFWVTDKCNGCGTCLKVCPVENIRIFDTKLHWMHECEQCFACLQWCPQEAIQYGKATLKRKRYRNPEVSIADLIK